MNVLDVIAPLRKLVDSELHAFLPADDLRPTSVHRAMRYSALGRGKRLRPILAILTAQVFGEPPERIAPVASALDLIHSYSLIHDDLPCMDDDDFRRGVPTCHKAFGEAIAVLAGDALLTCAFEMIIRNGRAQGFSAEDLLAIIEEISGAAGSRGMIAGQVEDIESEGRDIDVAALEYIDLHKTGRLFVASIRTGAILAHAPASGLAAVSQYGELFGRVFQITDDILDVEGSQAEMGKTPGSDERKAKATYTRLMTPQRARSIALELTESAVHSLDGLMPGAATLAQLVRYLPERRA
ncbi:MAG: polyprenyl synthetase family protein [Candidatus Riflebacteria bacterium]|nr:polyprenyl synthetase family protein [Candidatus Riflebacteria bacterium]